MRDKATETGISLNDMRLEHERRLELNYGWLYSHYFQVSFCKVSLQFEEMELYPL
jgi:hypothetical protein